MNNTKKVTATCRINNETTLLSFTNFLLLSFRKTEKARKKTKAVMAND